MAGNQYNWAITQPASGSAQTLTYGANFKFAAPSSNAAPPALSATLGAIDWLNCVAQTASVLLCSLTITYN